MYKGDVLPTEPMLFLKVQSFHPLILIKNQGSAVITQNCVKLLGIHVAQINTVVNLVMSQAFFKLSLLKKYL
jgi:hypothetical protein